MVSDIAFTNVHCTCLTPLFSKKYLSEPDHPETFQVIATVASPPFFVMSYRRSCKACQTNEATGSSRDNCDCAGVFRLSDSLLQEALSTGVTQVDILPLMANRQPHLDNNASHVAAQERDLRMVFAVLSLSPIPASDAALCELLHWFGSAVATGTPSRPQKTHDIVALCVHVVLALVVQGRQDVRAYMTEHSSDLLHQDLLWQRYELWLQLVTDKMDAHLNAIDVLRRAFTQALTTSCHVSHPSGYDTSTSKAPSPVSEFFVAQLREVYMVFSPNYVPYASSIASCSARTTPRQQPPATTERCAWNGLWELDIDSVRVDTLSKGAAASPSLLSLLRCFTMGYRFDQHVANQTLSVLSSLAIFPSKKSEFILDQTPRVFRVFPNGETSMSNCGGLTYGDYMGSLDGSAIRLDLFCWSTASPPTCTLVRLCVQAKSTLLLVTMDVAVHANSHAPADGMDEWTPSERVQHLHQHSPSGVPWLRVMGSYARRSKFNVNEGL
ncbi:hypothetical protein DYB30_010674 [Aphanomyces astaci]|uniref:Uncharacterized protein n=1 Tax=Aphanomyces astaci TaxID=112090 RepID=A0A397CBP9_APHAT|nr:hypothetical protein DYB30_010674 [Aphanomyces astaci]